MRRGIARTIVFAALAAGAAWGQISVSCNLATGPVEVNVFYTVNCTAADGTGSYTWQIEPAISSLPAGLTVTVSTDTTTATVSGSPTSPGAYSYEVQATDSNTQQTAFAAFGGVIYPAVAVTTTGVPNGVLGVTYSTVLQASGGIPLSYTWSITSGGLPTGLTLDPPSGTISGTPQAPGMFSFTATVTDSAPNTASQALSIAIGTLLSMGCLPTTGPTQVGVAYSATCSASGGLAPFAWSISPGTLPPNLMLSPAGASATIMGTPTTAGAYNYTVTVTDNALQVVQQNYSGTIAPAILTITTTSPLPGGTAGTAYNDTLAATGGTPPYTWSISVGSLPAALTLNASTGAITGIPAAAGATNFTAMVADSATTQQTATQPLSLTIQPAALTITTTSPLPGGTAGTAYNDTLTATGGTPPYTWSISTGSLPANLTLIASSGAITGTPAAAGATTFTAKVSDSASPPLTATQPLSITIQPAALTISTSSPLPSGTIGMAYSTMLTGAGGVPPYTWSIPASGGVLPMGLSLDPSTGAISGTPTIAGTSTVTIQLSDSASTTPATKPFTVTITNLAITTPGTLPNATEGVPYSETLNAMGGTPPYTWAVTSGTLPTGLSLNATTGAIAGTPTLTGGPFTFTIAVRDSTPLQPATATKVFALTVAAAPVITTASTLPTGSVGVAYTENLVATGGAPPYTWSITQGALPAGLSLNATSGAIAGTPTTAVTVNFTVQVRDSAAVTASKVFTLTIASSLAISTPSPLDSGEVGVAYSQTLAAVGGASPYTWSIMAGALPPNVTLSAAGVIAGTPTMAGTFNFTAQVVDHNSIIATKALALTVLAPVSVATPATLNGGSLNANYSATLAATGGLAPYTWTRTSGALPAGLALSSAGAITGAPTATGTFTFTAQVTDALGATASQQFTIVIAGGLAVASPTTLPGATVGAPYSQTLSASGGTAPYTWLVTAGSLPAPLSLTAGGLITGTPTAAGTSTFTAQVTDSAGLKASSQLTIVVAPAVSITTTSLPGGKVGTPYSQTLTATGGTPPYTFSLSAGSLPPGISIAASGLLSGSPTSGGTYSFTILVTDSASATATEPFTLVIGGLAITTGGTLPSAAVGAPYSQALAAAGGTPPYQWTLVGGSSTLPAGLSLDATSGTIGGTPTAAGNFTVTVQVTDSTQATASEALTLTVISASFTGVPATGSPAQQLNASLVLAAPYTADITGQVTLAFQPDASLTYPADDPSILFSNGEQTMSFTIPAGSTTPLDFSLQTGTVAGAITLTVGWQAGGATLAVPAALTQTIQIAPSAPVITQVSASTTSSGFQVQVTGYSTTRGATQANLQFTAASGQSLQTTSLTVSLTDAANAWFQSSASDAYGSQFVLTLPFTVTNGTASAIASVSVQLVNTQGTSNSMSAGL